MASDAPVRPVRWGLLAGLAWLAITSCALIAAIALAWHDGLADVDSGMLTCHYLAFMCQTFAYHAGLAMIPVGVFALMARRRRMLIVSAIVCAAGIGPELGTLWPRGTAGVEKNCLKIMSVNLMYGRGDTEALLAQISKEAPDVIVFQEWTREGARELREELAATFPHSVEQARDDAFGQAVISRQSFAGEPRNFPPVQGFMEPQITFAVTLDGRPLRMTNVHLLPPVGRTYFREQRACASRLARWLKDGSRDDRADVLIGDFNAPRRTGIISSLQEAGLADAQAQAGWWRGSSWPRTGFLRWMPGLRLDHALVRDTVECIEARTGEDFGSDHRPVIVRVRWRR